MTAAKQECILLVDDDAAHRALERRALTSSFPSLKIIEAASLREAERLAAEYASSLCLAIIDFNLDGECGADLIASLKKSGAGKTPALVLSTSNMEQDRMTSLEAGASRYLVKSSDPKKFQADLSQSVSALLAEKPHRA